jgi:hypothetical protein
LLGRTNLIYRKFFGQSNGSKPAPTQQTKLSFSTKSAVKAKERTEEGISAKENEDPNSGEQFVFAC